MNLQLSIAMAANPRSWPIFDGRVKPKGIDLLPSMVLPSELFWRQLKFAEFDISEMSFSSLIMAVAQGDDRFVGLPIFTTKRFFHAGILVRKDAGIEGPLQIAAHARGVACRLAHTHIYLRGTLQGVMHSRAAQS
jgi:4,5-dihydroxyphthalate decarboxylase